MPGRLIIRRIPDPNPDKAVGQPTLFQTWRFHAFFTTTPAADADTVTADKTHRHHAIGEPSPVGYRMVNGDAGGLWDTTELGRASWGIFYVEVEDVQATITRAEALGATVLMPLVDGGALEFAHLGDPQGNRFGIWRP